jgi:type I restriction enzyme R subunit
MAYLTEAEIEQILIEQFQQLGYTHLAEAIVSPDGSHPERESYSSAILSQRLRQALDRLNPHLPPAARDDAFKKIIATEKPNLLEENRRLHQALIEGIGVEFYGEDGTIKGDRAYPIDFQHPENNDWLVLNQFTVIDGHNNRRPDVVVFVNGLPLVVIELKNPGTETATLTAAYNQLQTYKAETPALFRTNAFLIIADGIKARLGTLTADRERFMPWRTIDGETIIPPNVPEMQTLIAGIFADRRQLLDLIQNFIVFGSTDSGLRKIIAGYHQFHAVNKAVSRTIAAVAGERKAGVIWHTQGSGKSLLMAFYAGQLVRHPELQNPTIVVITDRNDLDDQLFGTFAMCGDLIRQTPQQATSRAELQEILNRAAGGVVFTTIQKFTPEKGETTYPVLTDRRNVIVMADEAHRSQYGFKAKVNRATGDIAYGFAKYLRDALPNASFIGFTGRPIEAADTNTPAVFGDYIDIYDITRAVEDGATVPIYYESRLARIELPDDQKPQIDAEIEELFEDEEATERSRLNQKWATVQALVGAEKRLKLVAADLVNHFENRVAALAGKAMIVCISRAVCVRFYDQIVALRPDWHSDDDNTGRIKVVMTGNAADAPELQPHIGNKARRDLLAKRLKDPNDPLQLVIVRDMWLTGFDAPDLHTMYVDKPMKGHCLMQAIARVNRVFRDKPAGLVVDYIGIAQHLKEALRDYSANDQEQTGIDKRQAIALMLEKYDVVRSMFHGFNYQRGLAGTPQERLVVMAEAIEWILESQHQAAQKETDENAQKKAHQRYPDAVLALSKAFALSAASDEARQIRDEVGFFQVVRAALVKSAVGTSGKSAPEKEFAVQQIIDRAVVSTDILDILSAAGISSPDLSILSDDFLLEIQQLSKKNLALEALKRLLNDEIHSHARSTNVTEERKFSQRLEQAIARYHTNAISTVEVLQELIELAKDIRAARQRGEEQGLSADEIAFYDALAENQSAVEVIGNDSLKIIAHELLMSLKSNVTVDWAHRETARARLRSTVKRILRKYGYPPDLQDAAVQNVLQQAEALSASWTI